MLNSFTLFDDEVLPLEDVLKLIDYEENHPEESHFRAAANLQYRIFLARMAGKPTPE